MKKILLMLLLMVLSLSSQEGRRPKIGLVLFYRKSKRDLLPFFSGNEILTT